ncbi:MAG: tryptophan synthase subunit alpha [Phycisphaerae bacterium]
MSKANGIDRIATALTDHSPGLWPFIAAGHPNLDTTADLLRALNDLPIRGVELGIPFSDPIADGPVIQKAFTEALAGGITLGGTFDMVSAARGEIDYPLLAMVSASIVYRVGVESFVQNAAAAGFDGLIVPDLSLEEAPRLATSAAKAGMALSMLIAPTTPDDRQRRIADLASGFLYYVSVQGTTGTRDRLPPDLKQNVVSLKRATALPVLVGFGISRASQVSEVCAYADGAIVGSAIVRKMGNLSEAAESKSNISRDVSAFIDALSAVT